MLVPPSGLQRFETIEAHTGVEALAVCNDVSEYSTHIAVLNIAVENQRLLGAEPKLHVGRARTGRRRKVDAPDNHIRKLVIREGRLGHDIHGLAVGVAIIPVLQPRKKLNSNCDPEEDKECAAPGGAQRHPAAQPAEGTPVFLDRRREKIVEGFGKFAAALREQDTGRIQFIGGLRSRDDGLQEIVLFGKLGGARFALGDVCLNLLAFPVTDFVAGVENQERCNIFAVRTVFKSAHRKPPNSWRSLRVARKSEFLTVSSVVPRASPMARSFRP